MGKGAVLGDLCISTNAFGSRWNRLSLACGPFGVRVTLWVIKPFTRTSRVREALELAPAGISPAPTASVEKAVEGLHKLGILSRQILSRTAARST